MIARMMKRTTAAAYCDLSEPAFLREVSEGRLPCAIKLGGRDHWCKNKLDKALDRLTGADPKPAYLEEFEARYGSEAACCKPSPFP